MVILIHACSKHVQSAHVVVFRIHNFYVIIGLLLLNIVRKQDKGTWGWESGLTVDTSHNTSLVRRRIFPLILPPHRSSPAPPSFFPTSYYSNFPDTTERVFFNTFSFFSRDPPALRWSGECKTNIIP